MTLPFEVGDINSHITGSYLAIILYGSHARGDSNSESDVDLLQISDTAQQSYTSGRFNISVYTYDQLRKMASQSSLFILHIISEGKVLLGRDIISDLRNNFKRIYDYNEYRQELKQTSRLLDISKNEYGLHWKKYNSMLSYLFRSYLYSYLAEENQMSFSKQYILKKFNDPQLQRLLEITTLKTSNWELYRETVQLLEKYSGILIFDTLPNKTDFVQALADNSLSKELAIHFENVEMDYTARPN